MKYEYIVPVDESADRRFLDDVAVMQPRTGNEYLVSWYRYDCRLVGSWLDFAYFHESFLPNDMHGPQG